MVIPIRKCSCETNRGRTYFWRADPRQPLEMPKDPPSVIAQVFQLVDARARAERRQETLPLIHNVSAS